MVAIAAGPEISEQSWALVIGGVGGLVSTIGMRALQRLRIDDEVGAISVHMGAGVWGSLAVCIAGGGNFLVQLTGAVTIGVFVFGASLAAWLVIDQFLGARISPEAEELGQDMTELGIRSFPEFVRVQDRQEP